MAANGRLSDVNKNRKTSTILKETAIKLHQDCTSNGEVNF